MDKCKCAQCLNPHNNSIDWLFEEEMAKKIEEEKALFNPSEPKRLTTVSSTKEEAAAPILDNSFEEKVRQLMERFKSDPVKLVKIFAAKELHALAEKTIDDLYMETALEMLINDMPMEDPVAVYKAARKAAVLKEMEEMQRTDAGRKERALKNVASARKRTAEKDKEVETLCHTDDLTDSEGGNTAQK